MRACRRLGLKTRLVAKGPGISPPLKGNWRDVIDRHVDLGCDVLSPIIKWSFEHTLADFGGGLSREAIVDAIGESVSYMKSKGVRVVPWIVARSPRWIASNDRRPMPGMPNTDSVRIAPPTRIQRSRPSTVTTGVIAARSPWRTITRRSLRPFARAVRT